MTEIPFSLTAAAGFEPVIDVFRANFEDGGEHAAAFCVCKDGEVIIDLIGGWADRKKEKTFDQSNLVPVYSSGKAVAALVLAALADEDRFSYDTPIKSLWPEFDTRGKGDLSIAQVLSHQAGLSGITNPFFTEEDWYKWDLVCAELAAQDPLFPPGSASGYHPITFGFLAGEIARRADEFGRSLGQILREDICAPHNLDIWIGLPETEFERCAQVLKPRSHAELGEINPATKAAFLEKWSAPGRKSPDDWRKAQLAGSNCHATARSLAKIMQMAADGTACGEKFIAEDMLEQLRRPRISGPDHVLPFDVTFAAGIMRNDPNYFYGPNPNTVGHSGWGGSCVFADPDNGLSGAYVMTRQDNKLMGDPRPVRLIEALYAAI